MSSGRSLLHLQLQREIGYHHQNVHNGGHAAHTGLMGGAHHAHNLQGLHHASHFAQQLTRACNNHAAGTAATSSTESCHDSSSSSSRTPTDSIDISYGSSPRTNGATSPYSSSPKVAYLHKNHNHHHHSIQELIRHFSKRMSSWRADGGGRRNSCSVSEEKHSHKEEEEFRGRSKSLDGQATRRKISDCEATYRIYDRILKEGNKLVNLYPWLLKKHKCQNIRTHFDVL